MFPIPTNCFNRFSRHVFAKFWQVLLLSVWRFGGLIAALYQTLTGLGADGYDREPVMDDEGNTDKSKRSLYSKLRS